MYLHILLSGYMFVSAAFSEGMVDDGYDEVVNIDIASVVIEAMQKKYSSRPQLKCIFLEKHVKVGYM